MCDIYSQATFTIAATKAGNSDEGLFMTRDPHMLSPRIINVTWSIKAEAHGACFSLRPGKYWCDIHELCAKPIEEAPLNRRGWVCQERHLSRRILHFADTQLFWECHDHIACENYPTGLPSWGSPPWDADPTAFKRDLHSLSDDQERLAGSMSSDRQRLAPVDADLYFSWTAFRIHYTSCDLTEDGDKLMAIQGIAQQFSKATGDVMVAGMWRSRLLEDLCWFKWLRNRPDRPSRPPLREPTLWRAPTWSWASSNATIWVSNITKYHLHCKGRQTWSDLESIDVRHDEAGLLCYASLRLRCTLICGSVGKQRRNAYWCEDILYPKSNEPSQTTLTMRETRSKVLVSDPGFDESAHFHMDKLGQVPNGNVVLLIIQRCEHRPTNQGSEHSARSDSTEDGTSIFFEDDEFRRDCIDGIVLILSEGSADTFERVGYFQVEGIEDVDILLAEYEATEDRVITLI